MTKAESKLAQEMALEIAATLDNKTKQQNKYVENIFLLLFYLILEVLEGNKM